MVSLAMQDRLAKVSTSCACFLVRDTGSIFMPKDGAAMLLLAGGDKDSQSRDIERVKELARSARDGLED